MMTSVVMLHDAKNHGGHDHGGFYSILSHKKKQLF